MGNVTVRDDVLHVLHVNPVLRLPSIVTSAGRMAMRCGRCRRSGTTCRRCKVGRPVVHQPPSPFEQDHRRLPHHPLQLHDHQKAQAEPLACITTRMLSVPSSPPHTATSPGLSSPSSGPHSAPKSVSQLARTTPRPSGTTARGSAADEGARVPASAPVEEPRSRPGRSSRPLLANRIPNWGSPDESVHVGRHLPIWGSLRSIGTSGESRRPAAPRSWASPTSNATPRRRPPNDGPAATGASSRSCTSAFTPTARARRGASP